MKPPNESELRSLVRLLEDEDPGSQDLVRRQILRIGEPVLPFLDDFRASCAADLTPRVDNLILELRFRRLRGEFVRYASSPEPDLETGAFLLCRFGYPGLKTAPYSAWLDEVAASVRESTVEKDDPYAMMQVLNTHLFQKLGFTGNEDRYYDPDNSFLHRVIESRRGIPVSLSVLYLLAGKRLGLPMHGVGTPGHFLVAFREPNQACFYIDAFHRGRLLAAQDVRRMLVRTGYEFRPEYLERSGTTEILARMMRNLISLYHKAAAVERAELLNSLLEIMQSGPAGRPRPKE